MKCFSCFMVIFSLSLGGGGFGFSRSVSVTMFRQFSAGLRRGGSRMIQLRPIVVSGPSGCGKSTILDRLFRDYPDAFAFSVSHTTRNPRPGELHGQHYYFVTKDEIENAIKNGEFLENAEFGGNFYGTSKKAVNDIQETGRICILDIEIEGVKQVKRTDLNPRFIFIKPPTFQALEERLKGRNTESEESLRKRLGRAEKDMKEVEENPSLFDHVVVNDDLDEAYNQFVSLIADDLNAIAKKDQSNGTE